MSRPRRARRAPPRPGSRRSPSSSPGATRPGSSCRSTRCRCTAAWTSAPPSPPPAERAEVPHHLLDLLDPWEDGTVAWFQREAAGRHRRHRGARPPGAARRRHGALRAGGGRRPRHPRAVPRGARRASSRTPTPPALHAAARRARPAGRRPHGADQPPADRPGPRGDDGQRPAVLELRPRARRPPADRVHDGRAPARRATTSARGSRRATTQQMAAGLPRRGAAPAATTRAASPAPPARRSATRSCSTTSTATLTLDEALDLAIRRTGRFARRQRAWFRRDPRITWLDVDARGPTRTVLVDGAAGDRRLMTACGSTKHHGLGNDFLVLLDLDGTRPVSPEAGRRALPPAHRPRRRRAPARHRRAPTAPTSPWSCSTPTARRPR